VAEMWMPSTVLRSVRTPTVLKQLGQKLLWIIAQLVLEINLNYDLFIVVQKVYERFLW
jgi:hypothetical protein